MASVTLEGDHVAERGALRDDHWRGEVVTVAVLVGDVLDEQHEQDVVLVLAGIHAAAQFIAGGPDRGVEVGFLERHECFLVFVGNLHQELENLSECDRFVGCKIGCSWTCCRHVEYPRYSHVGARSRGFTNSQLE
jgi:xanthine dehydrogenase iron-sulfur cluster and FAD-binding subunit A